MEEFVEIAHCGGKVMFEVIDDEDGSRKYTVGWRGNRPNAATITGIFALPQGLPVATYSFGGLGDSTPHPKGCFPVLLGSDSHGHFGHNCPSCQQYWRSDRPPSICPYCGIQAEAHHFLSKAQRRYIEYYCKLLQEALNAEEGGKYEIDMDAVADSVGQEIEKPAFYVSDESQQHKFTCKACGCFNDILGRYGYCSCCGTRNDVADLEVSVEGYRAQLNAGTAPESILRDSVSMFDSFMSQITDQILEHVPMSKRRRSRLEDRTFHDLTATHEIFSKFFDIDLTTGMKESDVAHAALLFMRRHVYEHNGGEVDQVYLDRSSDTSVRLKQRLRESREGVHSFLNSLVKMARNAHSGFHELVPVIDGPIKFHKEELDRIAAYKKTREGGP